MYIHSEYNYVASLEMSIVRAVVGGTAGTAMAVPLFLADNDFQDGIR